ncbi:MAG: L,D-transpeptidase family protein [Chloroflexota bacterium]
MQRTYSTPAPQKPTRRTPAKTSGLRLPQSLMTWALIGMAALFFMVSLTIVALVVGALVIFTSGRILPGVSVGGIEVGSMTLDDATAQLQDRWSQITIRDGDRVWAAPPARFGLTLDAGASALAAQQQGRTNGSWIAALVVSEPVAPVVTLDRRVAEQGLKSLIQTVESPAQNATVRIVAGGNVEAVPPAEGRSLDINATLDRLSAAPGDELADGAIDLVMVATKPTVTDASALVDRAKTLLASPLTINAYDPITNQNTGWTLPADQWGQWLTTENGSSGLTFSLQASPLTNFLNGQNLSLNKGRHLDLAKSVDIVRKAVAAGRTTSTVQVLHNPTRYTVLPGDTIGTIAWKQGIMMWRIARANPGLDVNVLSAGQVITIPSVDDMLPLPIVEGKRIVVSISKQHMWVYDHGQIKWNWLASTGIPDSPTAPGVFQILSHDVNAYAGNWNLWMPHFMGIYEAVPGFTNGIHGFPTRNGQGILWEANLGTKVTFGCILISSTNAAALYNWAEDGVVIEIQA